MNGNISGTHPLFELKFDYTEYEPGLQFAAQMSEILLWKKGCFSHITVRENVATDFTIESLQDLGCIGYGFDSTDENAAEQRGWFIRRNTR